MKKKRESGFGRPVLAGEHMNEKTLLIVKIMLLCSACAMVAIAVIYVLKEWLGRV
jgi:hypothetical protein